MTYASHARALAAIELRSAASLRRDMAAGLLPRTAAISAIRDCLRHARACNWAASVRARFPLGFPAQIAAPFAA
ncbi:hypothetical protein [Paragemmobacter ruber]|uniref:Uncharacterized protein n=1 Tax=Paragemmobacter ruber TaxID=1985673 RepID=A0ABW9Y0E1_9RHOB|nr:hypothetical protein [Rhodobacter ruber]NBE05957.1 hypothetical protein [Rhodobacter ruber]